MGRKGEIAAWTDRELSFHYTGSFNLCELAVASATGWVQLVSSAECTRLVWAKAVSAREAEASLRRRPAVCPSWRPSLSGGQLCRCSLAGCCFDSCTKCAGEVRQLSRVRVAVPNALVVLEVSVEATKRAEALSCGGAQILNMFRRCSRCDDDLMTNLQLRIFTYLHARTCVPRKGQPPCKRQKFELHARIRLGKV